MAGKTCSSSWEEVSTTTFVRGDLVVRRRVASTPSMPGMIRSTNATSGACSVARRTASSPLPASATTAMSFCVSRNARTPCLTSAWSSTSKTVIGSFMLHHLGGCAVQRTNADDARPLARRTLDFHAPTELREPFAHALQAETIPIILRWVEPAAIVGDAQRYSVGAVDQVDLDALSIAVLGDVRQGFLGYAEERLLDLQGCLTFAPDVDLSRDLAPPRPVGGVVAQRRRKPLALERRRAHLVYENVQLLLGQAHQLVGLRQVGLGGFLVLLDQGPGGSDLQGRGEDLLLDRVVQVLGEAVAGLERREFPPGLQEVLELYGHAVKLPRELPQLVFGAVPGYYREVPMAPCPCGASQPPEASSQSPRGQKAKDRPKECGGGHQRDHADA